MAATNRKKIVIVGSSNTDLTVRAPRFPQGGETIIGSDFITAQGGKGANQAVAVARLGGEAVLVACLGSDNMGKAAFAALQAEGIDMRHVTLTDKAATGVAVITVDDKGENTIIVSSGANALLTPQDVDKASASIGEAALLLMQLETPLPTLVEATHIARANGALVVLNPAPFPSEPLPAALLRNVDIIIPNETEAEQMTGIKVCDAESALAAIRRIQELGVGNAIITAGSRGAYTLDAEGLVQVPAVKVQAVDTTAAGDTFCGALCVALTQGLSLTEAIRFANKAAAVSVTRRGAQPSIPFKHSLSH